MNDFHHHFDICNNSKFKHKDLFYKLKKWFVEEYGKFDCFVLQEWDDEEFDLDPDTGKYISVDVYATHKHILKEYVIYDKRVHIPTEEFYYRNYNMGVVKSSKRFHDYEMKCTDTFNRLKSSKPNPEAFESLKWLINWFREKEKIQLTLF